MTDAFCCCHLQSAADNSSLLQSPAVCSRLHYLEVNAELNVRLCLLPGGLMHSAAVTCSLLQSSAVNSSLLHCAAVSSQKKFIIYDTQITNIFRQPPGQDCIVVCLSPGQARVRSQGLPQSSVNTLDCWDRIGK